MSLKALALNATLKSSTSAEPSSRQEEFWPDPSRARRSRCSKRNDFGSLIGIKAGVTSDEGAGDAWPAIREKIACRYSFVWHTDMAQTNVERVQTSAGARGCILEETDEQGRMVSYGKVTAVAVVRMRMGLIMFLRNFSD